MKKIYTTPSVEKIAFRYRDQVVAESGNNTPANNIDCRLQYVEAWWPEMIGGGCNVLEYND